MDWRPFFMLSQGLLLWLSNLPSFRTEKQSTQFLSGMINLIAANEIERGPRPIRANY